MERDKVKVIQIQAYNLKSKTISGLKDSLKLYIQKSFGCKIQEDCNPQDYYILSCSQELDNGIYTFEIEEQIPLYSQVFVGLKQAVQAKTYLSNEEYLIKEYKEGFCIIGGTNICQINPLENMIQTNKPIPYEFQAITNLPIGILKAYKINYSLKNIGESYLNYLNNSNNLNNLNHLNNLNNFNDTNTISNPNIYNHSNHSNHINTISNTNSNSNSNLDSNINSSLNENTNPCLKDSTNLNNPHNEIYTIDTEQTIQLRAFVYEEQRTYIPLKEIKDTAKQIKQNHSLQQGNITKNIKEPSLEESSQIHWAFKIVSESYHGINATTGRVKKDKNGNIQGGEPFPPLESQFMTSSGLNKEYVYKKEDIIDINQILDNESYVVMNQTGDSITLSLKDLFTDKVLESLVGKNIIFFAYVNQPAYCIYQDNGRSGSKKQVLHDRITSIELKILKTRFSLEFDGEYLRFYENQRELKQWKAESLKTIGGIPLENLQKGTQILSISQFQEQNISIALHEHNIKTIPLKVEYQKRILIVIERFKETSESTKARMNIYIDRKRVDRNGNIIGEKIKQYEYYNPYFLPKENPYAYILERPGPDSIGGELKLRIPSGRYGVAKWYSEEGNDTRDNTLNLYNEFVHQDRHILIHNGNTPKNSDGCLLINKTDNNKENALASSIEAKEYFTNTLQSNNGIRKYFNNIDKDEIIKHIMVIIQSEEQK